MKKNRQIIYYSPLSIFFSIFLISSCSTPAKVVYFDNLQKDTTLHNLVTRDFVPKIHTNDLLYIGVASLDPTNTIIFNAPQNSLINEGGSNAGNTTGYLVDKEGNIQFPKLGVMRVEGLTRDDLKNKLQKDLLPYLKDPVVTIRFLNLQVTVLGEVRTPQVIPLTSESITVLQALGLSGDITTTGRRDNVLIIRESGTDKQFKRVNLEDNTIFNSEFYYLRPNDVLYVEPSLEKTKDPARTQRVLSYIVSGLSIVVVLLTRFIK